MRQDNLKLWEKFFITRGVKERKKLQIKSKAFNFSFQLQLANQKK